MKKTDSTFNAITITPNGSETIDGASSTTLNTIGETLKIVSDGANWQILERRTATDWIDSGANTFGATGSTPTKGTHSVDRLLWRRVGGNAEFRMEYVQTAAGTGGSGDVLIQVPFTMDTTSITTYTTVIGTSGTYRPSNRLGSGSTSITGLIEGDIIAYDSTHVRIIGAQVTFGTGGNAITVAWQASNFANSAITSVATFSAPIQGWNH